MFGTNGGAFTYICLSIVLFPVVGALFGIYMAIIFFVIMICVAFMSNNKLKNSIGVKSDEFYNKNVKDKISYTEYEKRKLFIYNAISNISNDYEDILNLNLDSITIEKSIKFLDDERNKIVELDKFKMEELLFMIENNIVKDDSSILHKLNNSRHFKSGKDDIGFWTTHKYGNRYYLKMYYIDNNRNVISYDPNSSNYVGKYNCIIDKFENK